MHELGLCQEIVEMAGERAGDQRVRRVVLEVGKLAAVMPDAMKFCFDLCTPGTALEGAQLEIVELPGLGRCRACGKEVEMDRIHAQCACGSGDLEWLRGEELRVREMEMMPCA